MTSNHKKYKDGIFGFTLKDKQSQETLTEYSRYPESKLVGKKNCWKYLSS